MFNTFTKKIIFVIVGIVFLLALSFGSYSFIYAEKIYPGVVVANTNVGSLTREQAKDELENKINLVKNKEIELLYDNDIQTIKPTELDVQYHLEQSLDVAESFGHSGSWWQKLTDRITSLYKSNELQVAFQINKTKLQNIINSLLEKINSPVIEATLEIKNNQVFITESKTGYYLEKQKLENQIIKTIGNLEESRTMNLPVIVTKPQLSGQNVKTAKSKIEKIMGKEIIFKSEIGNYSINQNDLLNWIELISVPNNNKQVSDYQLEIVFNGEKIKKYVANLAKQIDQEPVDARISYSGDQFRISSISKNGYKLDQQQALKSITDSLYSAIQVAGISTDRKQNPNSYTIELPVSVLLPNVTKDNINHLGIKELISEGTTKYIGSPQNRRHNIQVGSQIFDGVIIKPGEEFSFWKYMGDITAEKGFRKELVIKEDSTEPEIGGGLCQVSTTMFRAALNAGLNITERRNHKYRVSYYEPPVGLDATVYEPSPDLKFTNDTSGHILIQSEIKNDNTLTFYFYGTKDNRTVSISDPELYDHVSAPATRYVDDPDMNEGENKYLERAHAGVKAKVHYQVKRGEEVIHEQTFYSTYKAWGAVIKRGTKKVEVPSEEEKPVEESSSEESTPSESADSGQSSDQPEHQDQSPANQEQPQSETPPAE